MIIFFNNCHGDDYTHYGSGAFYDLNITGFQATKATNLSVGQQCIVAAWKEYGLIFTTENGTPIHPRNLLRDYKKLLHTAGLPPIRFHDLRHTAASILLNQGVPVITVSRRLGHTKASITLDIYGHLISTCRRKWPKLFDDLIMPVTVELSKKVEPGS